MLMRAMYELEGHEQDSTDHRRHRPGRRLPGRAAARQGLQVHGIKRRASLFNTDRVDHLYHDPHEPGVRFFLHYGDLTDATNLIRIVQETQPDEIYNLAAQSHVQVSFETPEYTANADALGHAAPARGHPHPGPGETVPLLPGLHLARCTAACRRSRRRETTPFYPRSPTAAAKVYAYWITVNYREAYGMHASNGILFNHESPIARRDLRHPQDHPRRGRASRSGCEDSLYLGNLDSQARLGPRARLRRGHVADAAAGRARTTT